jgi:uncharacterized protein
MKPESTKPARNPRRVIRWIILAAAVLLLALYIGLPVGMAVSAVLPTREAVGLPPQGFAVVSLTSEDGLTLAGWYAPPENGAAVILLHGAGGSREAVRPYAEMLVRHGYGVLALDLRGHGESGGGTNRLGWEGTRDVGAAVAFLIAQPDVSAIGALGLSMGGEVLLGAASAYPEIAAIAAEGATRRSTEELLALPSERPLVRNFTARVFYGVVQLLSGDQPPEPLLEAMVSAAGTRFLLIAGGEEPLEVAFNELFAETLGEQASLWVAQETPHTGGYARWGEEYEQRVIEFFAETLSGDGS